MMDGSDLFALILEEDGLLGFEREYRFSPPRKWRFDFANVTERLAIEVDGGQWKAGGGRHNTDADREKGNRAVCLGWRVLHFSIKQVTDSSSECIDTVKKAIEQRSET